MTFAGFSLLQIAVAYGIPLAFIGIVLTAETLKGD